MINTITLNPAIDRLLFIDRFERNVTARVREKAESLGGKGVHISVNLRLMGEPCRAFGILFGETGRQIENMLADIGVPAYFVRGADGPGRDSRTNHVIIENDGSSTIIAEHGVDLSDAELDLVLESLKANTAEGDSLVFSGDVSNAGDPYVYNRFMEAFEARNVRFFVDASGPALSKALEAAPFLIKPNRGELEEATGIAIDSEGDAIRAIRSLDRFGIQNIALSLGIEGSIVRFGDDLVLRAVPPDVPVKNTTGCGDAFLAGLIAGFTRGWEAGQMLRYATAVSSATAASPLCVGYETGFADALFEQVFIKKL